MMTTLTYIITLRPKLLHDESEGLKKGEEAWQRQ